MQEDAREDTIGRMLDLLGVGAATDEAARQQVEVRAAAMLQVSLQVLDARNGRERAVSLVEEAFGNISKPDHQRTALALAATPAEQMAETLLGYLRQRDPVAEGQVEAAHGDAGAMILAGVAFLQERHGGEHMASYAANLIRVVQDAAAAGRHPVSPPSKPTPVTAPPAVTRAVVPNPRDGLTLGQRIGVMADFLRNSAPADAQADALASIMASGMVLRERFGEAYAVEAMRHVEGTVSQMAALDRWQPPEGARPI